MAEQKDDENAGHAEKHPAKHTQHEHEVKHEPAHAREHKPESEANKEIEGTGSPQHAGASAAGSEIKIAIPSVSSATLSKITIGAAILLLIIALFQANEARTALNEIETKAAKALEESKQPVIQLTVIEADCPDCTQITTLLDNIKGSKFNITKSLTLPSTDEHSKRLISEYGITKLPSVVVTGELDKVNLASAGFTKINDALVYTKVEPPYFDIAGGQVKGLVAVTLVNASSCQACSDLMPAVQQLMQIVKIGELRIVDSESAEGKRLIAEYSMARLPGLLLSSDIKEYEAAAQIAQIGTQKKDGVIAVGANAPYLNTSTGKVAGVTQIILLNDSSCTGCYDPTLHTFILESNFQMYVESARAVDISSAEGKELISKYKITAVPTFLLTGDIAPYDRFRSTWPTVGTVESDGTYVFRTMSAIPARPYINLTTGKLEPNAPPQQQEE